MDEVQEGRRKREEGGEPNLFNRTKNTLRDNISLNAQATGLPNP